MHTRLWAVALSVTLITGCDGKMPPYPPLDGITRVDVRVKMNGTDTAIASIASADSIERIVAFVNARRTGWKQPWAGVPVPSVSAEFYRGTRFVGHVGSGVNFLETQRSDDFSSRSASPDEVAEFNALLGVGTKVVEVPPATLDDTAPPNMKLSLADQEAFIRSQPACAPARVGPDARWTLASLTDPPGDVRLPHGVHEVRTREPRMRTWVAPDSSELTFWADSEPSGAVAGDRTGLMARLHGTTHHEGERPCRLDIAGHFASIDILRITDERGADTVFGVIANVSVRPGLAVGMMGLTPSQAMRDSLLGAIAGLRLTDRSR